MSASEPLTCLGVGNRYLSGSLMADRLADHAARRGIDISCRSLDLPYPAEPAVPFPETLFDGVRAYWEAPSEIAARAQADEADPALREYVGPVDALADHLAGVDIVLLHNAPLSRNALAAASGLRVVGTVRTTPNNINIEDLNRRRIPLFTTPSRNAQSVAEHIVGALIAHVRGIVDGASSMAEGIWSFKPWISGSAGIQLSGRTCGLIGFGKVGSAFAVMARAIGMELIVSDPYADPGEVRDATGSDPFSLETILERSDVIVLTARLNQENTRFIDEAAFRRMKPSAVFVNTARSALVDQSALHRALTEGWIGGAVLDVYDNEPPSVLDGLTRLPNTLLTPHQAGATRDTAEHGADILAVSVTEYLATGSSHNCFNPSVLADR